MKRLIGAALLCAAGQAETTAVRGLHNSVEILRDRWGVPHIYAQSAGDLFFAQGYITAKDRLFQIDLWRRVGTGKLAEVLGPAAVARDRLARAVRFRGNADAEWQSYGPDARQIAVAFTSGINAYIRSLQGARPLEFRAAGYDPGLWEPEDVLARIAGLLMTRNLEKEVTRVLDARRFGLETLVKFLPPDPAVSLEPPAGLDLNDISADILREYKTAIGVVHIGDDQGSNNWVVDGTMTASGKPMLANDPHRPVQIPSLRKTVHLVGPGWNAIGAGEPALPGIALGHNEYVAFGFTIVGIDQQDLYVEKLDPASPDRYWYHGAWKAVEVERQTIAVKGSKSPQPVELRYTVHGPIIHEDRERHRAYALRWVGMEPGTAGYLAGLRLARAKNWDEFRNALDHYRVPAENIVYADTAGNIGWQATGLTPIRKTWSGLYPVPGDSAEYEWDGFRSARDLPFLFNPPAHFIATANHKILPPGYIIPLGYEWAQPFRFQRIHELLFEARKAGRKLTVADFERMQQDVTSMAVRRFQAILRDWHPKPGTRAASIAAMLTGWDGALTRESRPAVIYEVWSTKLPAKVFGPELGARTDQMMLLETLEKSPNPKALEESLDEAWTQLEQELGPDSTRWHWGRLHQIRFVHPVNDARFHRGPVPRPGDANTLNSTSGAGFSQTNGASYREIFDLSDWDKAMMTNVPGESGDPASPHYSDLLADWEEGRYHPLPFSRKAVEAATTERIVLTPATAP